MQIYSFINIPLTKKHESSKNLIIIPIIPLDNEFTWIYNNIKENEKHAMENVNYEHGGK